MDNSICNGCKFEYYLYIPDECFECKKERELTKDSNNNIRDNNTLKALTPVKLCNIIVL